MDDLFFLTGYNKDSLPLVDSPLDDPINIAALINRFVDISQCQYGDNEGTPIGLEGSSLLGQLPWLTPWKDLFRPIQPFHVF